MIHYQAHGVTLHHGDALAVLATLADNSVDAVVTDPPYGLEFMGKEWDSFAPERGQYHGERADTSKNIGTDDSKPSSRHHVSFPMGRPTFRRCRLCAKREFSGSPCRCDVPEWDYEQPTGTPTRMAAFQQWCTAWAAECLRVLKPGGHLLAFGGTRTAHRLTSGIEDAGFEIRDSVAWLYSTGFPKAWNFGTQYGGQWCSCPDANALPYSHDSGDVYRVRQDLHDPSFVAQAGEESDVLSGVQREGAGPGLGETRTQGPGGMDRRVESVLLGEDVRRPQSGLEGWQLYGARQGLPDDPQAGPPKGPGERIRGRTPAGDGADDRSTGDATGGGAPHQRRQGGQPARESTSVRGSHGALDDRALRDSPVCTRCGGLGRAFRGFSTALKPAHEPVTVARKPLQGSVAANVLAWGTGAINIDAGRIGTEVRTAAYTSFKPAHGNRLGAPGTAEARRGTQGEPQTYVGRWPANVALDESAAAELDTQSGDLHSGANPTRRGSDKFRDAYGDFAGQAECTPARGADSGGASRFLYVAKADADERPRVNGTSHPTVKPLALMRWLVRMFSPPGGTVLDPFAGSGTTAEACLLEGMRCVTIEREADYLPFVVARVTRQRDPVAHVALVGDPHPTLFDPEGDATA